jgi:hypothetical protein
MRCSKRSSPSRTLGAEAREPEEGVDEVLDDLFSRDPEGRVRVTACP